MHSQEPRTRRGSSLLAYALVFWMAACSDEARSERDEHDRAGADALGGLSATPASAGSMATGAAGGSGRGEAGTKAATSRAGAGGSPSALRDGGVAGAGGAAGTAAVGGTGGAAGAGGAAGSDSANDCLDDIGDYTTEGPFTYESTSSGMVNLWIPDVPAGCRVPIVHIANGTGAPCAAYTASIEHLASHGFLVTCYESPNTGEGTQCVMAIETALMAHPDVADMKVGSAGHSTGGSSALSCVYRAEEKWGDSLQIVGYGAEPDLAGAASAWPDHFGQVSSPIFIFSGSEDNIVPEAWTRDIFEAVNPSVEAYWYEAVGATHVPVPESFIQGSSVAWFRWKLLGDQAACEYFKSLPDSNLWDLKAQRNPTGC